MAGGADPAGARRRILVVEDEALIALMIEEMLEGFGLEPVGPAASAADAAALIAAGGLDGAVIDLMLGGTRHGLTLAETLDREAIPFVVVTGFGADYTERLLPGRPVLTKPFTAAALRRALDKALALPT